MGKQPNITPRECIEHGYRKCIECSLVDDIDKAYLRELHEVLKDEFGRGSGPKKLKVLESIMNNLDLERFNNAKLHKLTENSANDKLSAFLYLAGGIIRAMENFEIIRQPFEI